VGRPHEAGATGPLPFAAVRLLRGRTRAHPSAFELVGRLEHAVRTTN
jgi:hypothetical protein